MSIQERSPSRLVAIATTGIGSPQPCVSAAVNAAVDFFYFSARLRDVANGSLWTSTCALMSEFTRATDRTSAPSTAATRSLPRARI